MIERLQCILLYRLNIFINMLFIVYVNIIVLTHVIVTTVMQQLYNKFK